MGSAESPHQRLTLAHTLAVDAVGAEVVEAFRAVSVRPILLKGPALERLLYPEDARGYVDVDLLVSGPDAAGAEAVLDRLGFRPQPIAVEPDLGLPHARPWARGDLEHVDLHRTLAGVGAAPEDTWALLERRTHAGPLSWTEVEMLDEAGLALVVALHASQHIAVRARPAEDLRRALEVIDAGTWSEAAALAVQLDAQVAFASGLRSEEAGARLAEQLGLPDPRLVEAARQAGSSTRLALGFERLAEAPDLRTRLRMIFRELAPSPEHMRWWSPLARRGRRGLAAAYVQRALLFARHAPASFRAWRRVSRER